MPRPVRLGRLFPAGESDILRGLLPTSGFHSTAQLLWEKGSEGRWGGMLTDTNKQVALESEEEGWGRVAWGGRQLVREGG